MKADWSESLTDFNNKNYKISLFPDKKFPCGGSKFGDKDIYEVEKKKIEDYRRNLHTLCKDKE